MSEDTKPTIGPIGYESGVWVKDCACQIAPRVSFNHGEPLTCEACGKAWTRVWGPSNDEPTEVQIEIRAAELTRLPPKCFTDDEWDGYARRHTDSPSQQAGWLALLIEEHEDL